MQQEKIILAAHSIFETERLRLRRVDLADAESMFSYMKRPEATQFLSFPPHEKLADTEKLIASGFMSQTALTSWGLTLKNSAATSEIIGTINFVLDKSGKIAEFGYLLSPDFWGQGLMSEAVSVLRDFVFEALNVQVVCAEVMLENKASQVLLEKLAWQKLGEIYRYFPKKEKLVRCAYLAQTCAQWAQIKKN